MNVREFYSWRVKSANMRDGPRGAAPKASLETRLVILSYSNQLLRAIDLVSSSGCWSGERMCAEQRGLCANPPTPHLPPSHPPWLVTQASKSRAPLIPPPPAPPPPLFLQVTRPAVAMVTSQSEDRGASERSTKTAQSHPASFGAALKQSSFLQLEI